ncbi:MAG: hypothetical protein VST68_08405 [Nitrospirota bacterium]|nr:hypothetical protein [Nitrospirota bacterium]
MRKLNAGTMVLLMVVLLVALMVGCGGESPESLFGTAQFEEQQTNFAHAKELYQQIIRDHPDSEWAKQAKERIEELQQMYPEN